MMAGLQYDEQLQIVYITLKHIKQIRHMGSSSKNTSKTSVSISNTGNFDVYFDS